MGAVKSPSPEIVSLWLDSGQLLQSDLLAGDGTTQAPEVFPQRPELTTARGEAQ